VRLEALQIDLDCLPNVGDRFIEVLALAMTALQGGTRGMETAVRLSLEDDCVVGQSHDRPPEPPSYHPRAENAYPKKGSPGPPLSARDFDTFEEAVAFARHNYPSVICERSALSEDRSMLRERARFDLLYDSERGARIQGPLGALCLALGPPFGLPRFRTLE